EILRLIEQLNQGPDRAPSSGRSDQPPAKLLDKRISRRREELSGLRDQRQQTALHLLEERLLAVCDTLDKRINKIEQLLEKRPATAAPERTVGGGMGTEIAGDLSAMQPDTGMLQGGVLTDILQFISTNDKTGVFVTVSEGDETQVYFREGQIYHCEAGDVTGDNALFVAMAIEHGRFYFDETDEIPDDKTIDGNTQFLILEALRQIDESRGGE
ncbi:MAG: DUF4388 domain-containing protein, partial [Deltaproteobacteria bacterium]|nr:DUF4388 domain-containing protein [Deltaproteobacteria bacterium]